MVVLLGCSRGQGTCRRLESFVREKERVADGFEEESLW